MKILRFLKQFFFKKQVKIDYNYLVRVSELMEKEELPRPRKRLTDVDGSKLPLILLNTSEELNKPHLDN